MDPTTHFLDESPRDINEDAFFLEDRSESAVTRTVNEVPREDRVKDPEEKKSVWRRTPIDVRGYKSRHTIQPHDADNPLPQQRMTKPQAKGGVIDQRIAGWTEVVVYRSFLSASGEALRAKGGPARVQVTVLFGVGSEAHRHGVCGSVVDAPDPTLLIIVPGIEPEHGITVRKTKTSLPIKVSPDAKAELLVANNRWGVGITMQQIRDIANERFDRTVDCDITVLAAYSTGYLGLAGSIGRHLMLDRVKRIVIYDCLYTELKAPLQMAKSIKGSIEIVAYVASEAGNNFIDKGKPTFDTLTLGKIPGWNYINLFYNPSYYALAACRLVAEGCSLGSQIITQLPPGYVAAASALLGKLPKRLRVVADPRVFTKVKGSMPSDAEDLPRFAAANKKEIDDFSKQGLITSQCIRNAWLLGWDTPVGDEWHDMLLVEFAWEYLT